MIIKKIKSIVFVVLSLFSLLACAESKQEDVSHIGKITAEQLFTHYDVFQSNYDGYSVTVAEQELVKTIPANITIDVYFGTWCHDSEREVPRLLKVLSGNGLVEVKLVALDYQKRDPAGAASQANVKYTPTIIVKQDDIEIGRIVERPLGDNLVTDIVSFMNKVNG